VEISKEELQKMSFEVLNNIKTTLANKVINVNTNKKYSDMFKQSLITSVYDEMIEYVDENGRPDIRTLNETEMELLGFGKWDEDTGLRLIPLWAKPFIKNIEVTAIDGEKIMLDQADNDIRFGCIAYGIIPDGYVKDETKGQFVPKGIES